MSQGSEAVDPSEFVLRRIPKSQFSTSTPPRILRVGFCPNKQDVTGISVYREKDTTVAAVVSDAKKPNECYVVRILVQSLIDLGLSLIPEVDPGGPAGHCVIPELRLSEYEDKNKKNLLKDKQEELARIASDNIVHRPPGG
jgi:hypothetical protein